jgi:hypothetical protein
MYFKKSEDNYFVFLLSLKWKYSHFKRLLSLIYLTQILKIENKIVTKIYINLTSFNYNVNYLSYCQFLLLKFVSRYHLSFL